MPVVQPCQPPQYQQGRQDIFKLDIFCDISKKYHNAIPIKRSCEKQDNRWIVFCCKLYQTFVKIIKWSCFHILGFLPLYSLRIPFFVSLVTIFLLEPSPIISLPCHSVSKSSFWVFLRLLDFLKLLHGFVKIDTWISLSCYTGDSRLLYIYFLPCAKQNQAFWSFCFELIVLNESKYSMPWVRCAFGNVFY